jgi:hypothetical protein
MRSARGAWRQVSEQMKLSTNEMILFARLMRLLLIPVIAALLGLAAAGIADLAGGIMALSSALGPLIGLLGAILLQLWIPLQQILGPYDYTVNSWFLLLSPLLFATGALVITLQVQEMHLSEEGQEDSEKRRYRVVNGVADPTAITGGKLYASLLLLLFGAIMAMIQLQGHVATFRAYEHSMPPPGTLAPIESRKFLLGSGLQLVSI